MRYQLNRRQDDFHNWSGNLSRREILFPLSGFEPLIVQPCRFTKQAVFVWMTNTTFNSRLLTLGERKGDRQINLPNEKGSTIVLYSYIFLFLCKSNLERNSTFCEISTTSASRPVCCKDRRLYFTARNKETKQRISEQTGFETLGCLSVCLHDSCNNCDVPCRAITIHTYIIIWDVL
jgi:hypothetical protein